MSNPEALVRKKFESVGFTVLKRGSPDFIVYKEEGEKLLTVFFIEVKSAGDHPNKHQKEYHRILRKMGFDVKVMIVPNTSTTNQFRKDRREFEENVNRIDSLGDQYESEAEESQGDNPHD